MIVYNFTTSFSWMAKVLQGMLSEISIQIYFYIHQEKNANGKKGRGKKVKKWKKNPKENEMEFTLHETNQNWFENKGLFNMLTMMMMVRSLVVYEWSHSIPLWFPKEKSLVV